MSQSSAPRNEDPPAVKSEDGSDTSCNVARFLAAMAARQPDALALRVPRGRRIGKRDGASAAPTGSERAHADEEAEPGDVLVVDLLPTGSEQAHADEEIDYIDLTFAQLDAETDAWAHRLSAAGVARGTRVLLLVTPGLSLIALCFALFKIGAVPVVIDPGMGVRAFLRCVRRTGPQVMIAIGKGVWLARIFRGAFRSVKVTIRVRPDEAMVVAEGGADIPNTSRRGAPSRRAVAAAADTLFKGDLIGSPLEGRAGEAGRGVPQDARQTRARFPAVTTAADELAAIVFTSGSTGAPKGVCYEHGMFDAQVRAIRDTYGIKPGEVDLPMLPIFALFNPALGMTTVVPEMNPSRPATVDPAKIVQAIRQCGVTNSFGSPVLWRRIADHCLREKITLPTLRRVLSAGAPVPPSLMADFRRVMINGVMHSPYGATESLPVSTISDREVVAFAAPLTAQGHGTCVGRPVAGMEVRIIRISDEPIAEWNETLIAQPGAIGEIVVRGAVVTRAYDRLDDATRAAKIATHDGGVFHRMGDTGYFDAEGRLWFCGRKVERVLTANGAMFTDQCEPIFNQHPSVARAAFIGLGEPGRQVPAIVIEPKPGNWPANAAAREACARELRALGAGCATTRAITRFFFHRSFPVDVRHNAKIHRLTLARDFARKQPIEVS